MMPAEVSQHMKFLAKLNWHGPKTQFSEGFPAYPRPFRCLNLKTVN